MNAKNTLKQLALATAFTAAASSIALPLVAQAESSECENFARSDPYFMMPLKGVNAPAIESKIYETIQPSKHRICYIWRNFTSTQPTVTPPGETCIDLDPSKKGKDFAFTFAPKGQYAPIVIPYSLSSQLYADILESCMSQIKRPETKHLTPAPGQKFI